MATKVLKTRRKCELCGYEFTARRRYCSGLCKQRAYQARRRNKGGQHRPTVGVSTHDPRDEYHYGPLGNPDRVEARALAAFEAERLRLAGTDDVAF